MCTRNTENADEIGQVGRAQSQTLRLPSTERIQGFKTGSEAILPFTAASKQAGLSARTVEHHELSPVMHHPVYCRDLPTVEDIGGQAAAATAEMLVPRRWNRARGHRGQTTPPLPTSVAHSSIGVEERPVQPEDTVR